MFGRLEELTEVLDLVRQSQLVTVVGTGGVGKSTLVRAVSESLDVDHLFAPLEELTTDGFQESLAGELGSASWSDLLSYLEDRRIVLILDNCEHVLGALRPLVADLMDRSEHLSLLISAREPLGLADERLLRLEPLSLEGAPSPAASFLVDTVEARGLPTPTDLGEVEALCSSLDGLPLALELAAGRMSSMTAAEIKASVETRLDLLTRSRPTSGHHSGLDATIEWSLDLLDRPLRLFQESLSLFDGPFGVELAAAVGGQRRSDAVLMLHDLIEKSLIVHAPIGGVSWYRMLNTVRTHCRKRLVDSGAADLVQDRLVDALAARWSRFSQPETHMGDLAVIDEVRHHYRTVKSAVLWCIGDDPAPDRVGRLLAPLLWLEEIGNHAEAADLLVRIEQRWPEHRDLVSMSKGIRANFLQLSGATVEAQELAVEAVEATEPFSGYLGHRVLGIVDRRLNHYDSAISHFRAGAEVARRGGWDAHALEVEAHAALATYAAGDEHAALSALADLEIGSRSYPLCHRTVELFYASLLIHTSPGQAEAKLRPILAESRSLGHAWAMGTSAYLMAAAAVLQGDLRSGAGLLGEAIEAYDSSRNMAELQRALVVASSLLEELGDTPAANEARAAAGRLPDDPVGDPISEISRVGVNIDEVVRAGAGQQVGRIAAALRKAADQEQPFGALEAGESSNAFLEYGDFWEVEYRGVRSLVKHAKGMEDLARLLSEPGREISSLDLMNAVIVEGDTGSILDRRARAEYEARIRDLQDEIDEAEDANDLARAESSARELDQLLDQLARAHGLGGRKRRTADTAERARSAVTWRIRSAIDRISVENPSLGEHLTRCVKTGRFCVYVPESDITWRT